MLLTPLRMGMVLVASAWGLGGCAIYSETRDKQGQAETAAWAKAKAALAEPVAMARKNLQTLLDEQLVNEDDSWQFRRSQLAAAMAYGSTLGDFRKLVAQAQERVGKGPDAAFRQSQRDIQAAQASIASAQSTLDFFGLKVPDCKELTDVGKKKVFDQKLQGMTNENAKQAMMGVEPSLVDACNILEKTPTRFAASGEWLAAESALRDENKALELDKNAGAAAQREYQSALDEYNAEAKAYLNAPASSRDKLTKALDKLAKLEGALEKVDNAFSDQFVAQARLDSLDRFLSTYKDIAAGKAAPDDANRTAIALAVFSDLRDKTASALKDLERPNLVPLVTQKNIEQAKIDAAQRDIDIRHQLIVQRQAYLDALRGQAEAYQRIQEVLATPEISALGDATTLRDALRPVSTSDNAVFERKVKLWRAVARYLDAEGRLRADAGKAQYRVLALQHQQSLTYAESNIAQWTALIDPSVQVLGNYAAAGLKPTDITAFLNSLTLLWIGAGVHR